MTNGEKLVKAFPDIELYKKMHGGIQIDFDSAWWNAEYKEPTTKNNLGVDCISRADAIKGLGEQPYVWTDSDFEIQQLADWKTHKEMLENLPTLEDNVYKAIQEMMKYEHEGFINISLARLDEILKKCGVSEDGNVD